MVALPDGKVGLPEWYSIYIASDQQKAVLFQKPFKLRRYRAMGIVI
jgi:hypothetical protein